MSTYPTDPSERMIVPWLTLNFLSTRIGRCVGFSLLLLVNGVLADDGVIKPAPASIGLELDYEASGVLKHIEAELVLEAQDGGRLLIASDGQLHLVQPKEIKRENTLSNPFRPMNADEIGKRLLAELPSDFKILKTDHYVLCYDTSDAYAKWTSLLFERLYRGFHKFWKSKDIKLHEPRFPLVALVFESKKSYLKYAQPELGRGAESMLGYYNLMSNRVTTFDLTGIEGLIAPGQRVNTSELVSSILSRPEAERAVATVVHEAFHQLSYNCGLQIRLADNPVWVSEGLATYFETPDSRSKEGWGSIGRINTFNMNNFRAYLPRRNANGLVELLSEDKRFRDPQFVSFAYGESWALNYFLLKSKSKDYANYLKFLGTKRPLEETDPKKRIQDFQDFFGDLSDLDRDFIRFMSKQ